MYYCNAYLCAMKEDFLKNWETQLKKGLLPFFVLLVLKKKLCYGYELIEELRLKAGLDATESTMYPLLSRLQKEGLLTHKWVEQTSGIPRKYYTLTTSGVKYLKDMIQTIEKFNTKMDLYK
jgi:PadR family transcriptional regulator, regulatory protein PadR